MSEKNNQLAYVKPETIITIEISGAFQERLTFLLFNELRKYPKEESDAIMNRIKTDQFSLGPEEDVIHVLAGLVGAIATAAREQDKLDYKDKTQALQDVQDAIDKMPPYKPRG